MVGAMIPGTKLLLLYHQKCHLAPHVGNPWGSHLAWIHTPTCEMQRPHVSGVPGDVNTVVSIPDLPLLLKEDYTYPFKQIRICVSGTFSVKHGRKWFGRLIRSFIDAHMDELLKSFLFLIAI